MDKYPVIWREAPESTATLFFLEGFQDEIRPGQTLIDFGCGNGAVAQEFLKVGLNTTLVDIAPYSLDENVRNLLSLQQNKIRFVQACLWRLPASLEAADWIYCSNRLEHIPEENLDTALASMAKRMRLGGYLSLSLETRGKPWWEERISTHFRICAEDVIADDQHFNCRVLQNQKK